MMEDSPFGVVIGETIFGVLAYSDGDAQLNSGLRPHNGSLDKTILTGVAWDSVEFVRRFTAMTKGVLLPPVPSPASLWDVQRASIINGNGHAPVSACENGANGGTPQTGDIIVWQRNTTFPLGHVAVVVHATKLKLYVAEQGLQQHQMWPHRGYSRELHLRKVNELQCVTESEESPLGNDILGWLHVMAPFVDLNRTDVPDRFRRPCGAGWMRRTAITRDLALPWIDKSDSCGFFLRRSLIPEGTEAVHPEEVPSGFYTVDYDLWQRLRIASEELHELFSRVAKNLIMDPRNAEALVTVFGIPEVLHAALRASLDQPFFAGRFDFGYDGSALKVFEYNCDSSAALLETADTQERIAAHYGFNVIGSSAGATLSSRMTEWWSRVVAPSPVCPKNKTVHFLVDDDDEERYTALCVMRAAEAAGFRCKLCVKLIDFKFDLSEDQPSGGQRRIVDLEGLPVTLVWKTWNWTTAIRDFKASQQRRQQLTGSEEEAARSYNSHIRSDSESGSSSVLTGASATAASVKQGRASHAKPTLSDVLLSSNVTVLEPLWKVVAGSKGLLPYVYRACPDHANLLPASFDLSDIAHIEGGYVHKPVSGRGGTDVTIVDPGQSASSVNTTQGNGDVIVYQAKCDVASYDSYFPVIGSWMVGSRFAGAAVREDRSRVTSLASCVAPLRVLRSDITFPEPAEG